MKIREGFLYYNRPYIQEEEISEVVECLKSGWLTTGPRVKLFEKNFAEFHGVKHAIALNSGTAALHLSLLSVGVGEGDEVITTSMTFGSTINAIIETGAIPILCDITTDTHNIDVKQIEAKITEKTKAIIPVHIGGYPCDMDVIMDLAGRYGLYVIEDAAHAVFAEYRGEKIGTIGDLTAFSFYATKNLCTGEGGMITTNNDKFAENIRKLYLHGISKDAFERYTTKGAPWYYEIVTLGYKYNMPDIMAALGLKQLERQEFMQKERSRLAAYYSLKFQGVKGIEPPEVTADVLHAWHLYVIKLSINHLAISRNQFIEELTKMNIGTSVHFIPIHFHQYYRNKLGYRDGDFPVCEDVFERSISLPLYPGMTCQDVDYVVDVIQNLLEANRKEEVGSE